MYPFGRFSILLLLEYILIKVHFKQSNCKVHSKQSKDNFWVDSL